MCRLRPLKSDTSFGYTVLAHYSHDMYPASLQEAPQFLISFTAKHLLDLLTWGSAGVDVNLWRYNFLGNRALLAHLKLISGHLLVRVGAKL